MEDLYAIWRRQSLCLVLQGPQQPTDAAAFATSSFGGRITCDDEASLRVAKSVWAGRQERLKAIAIEANPAGLFMWESCHRIGCLGRKRMAGGKLMPEWVDIYLPTGQGSRNNSKLLEAVDERCWS